MLSADGAALPLEQYSGPEPITAHLILQSSKLVKTTPESFEMVLSGTFLVAQR